MEETGTYKVKTDSTDPKQQQQQSQQTQQALSQDEITNSTLENCGSGQIGPNPHLTKIQADDNSLVIANQPRAGGSRKVAHSSFHSPFNDANSERDWHTHLCPEATDQRPCLTQCCCWPAYRYSLAIRLGETPFMPLIPCAAFALRIKIRTLFGIKGSLMKDFFTAMCCEPCAICQMTREMDQIGL